MTVETLLAFIIGLGAGMAWERWGTRTGGGDEPVEVVPTQPAADASSLRVEWKDHLDRMEHLYDRIRKRARVAADREEPVPGSDGALSKDQLRDVARRKGLM